MCVCACLVRLNLRFTAVFESTRSPSFVLTMATSHRVEAMRRERNDSTMDVEGELAGHSGAASAY